MSKFTPGPLTINQFGEIMDAMGEQLLMYGVSLPCGNHAKVEEAKANSRLMAAAPDILAALEAVEWAGPQYDNGVTIINTCPHCGMDEPGGHAENCLIGNAIRKARGEE